MSKRLTPRSCTFPGCSAKCVTTKARYCLECQQMFAVSKHKTYAAVREYQNEFITLAQFTERLAAVRRSAVILMAQMDSLPPQKPTARQPSGQTLSVLVPSADRQCFFCPLIGAGCREQRIPPCKPAGGMFQKYREAIISLDAYW